MTEINTAADPIRPGNAWNGKTYLDRVDTIEAIGLTSSWHLAQAMMHLLESGGTGTLDQAEKAEQAAELLNFWLDSDFDGATAPMPGDDVPKAAEVVAEFQLSGNIAVAATYLIDAARACADPEYDVSTDVAKAVAALETYSDQA